MSYVFPPDAQPSLPVKGSDKLFPIHRIYCVGRNYAEHTKRMGGDTRDPPFFRWTKDGPADVEVVDYH